MITLQYNDQKGAHSHPSTAIDHFRNRELIRQIQNIDRINHSKFHLHSLETTYVSCGSVDLNLISQKRLWLCCAFWRVFLERIHCSNKIFTRRKKKCASNTAQLARRVLLFRGLLLYHTLYGIVVKPTIEKHTQNLKAYNIHLCIWIISSTIYATIVYTNILLFYTMCLKMYMTLYLTLNSGHFYVVPFATLFLSGKKKFTCSTSFGKLLNLKLTSFQWMVLMVCHAIYILKCLSMGRALYIYIWGWCVLDSNFYETTTAVGKYISMCVM